MAAGDIQTLKDTGPSNTILSEFDAAMYRLASVDCVLEGIGTEFQISYSSSSLAVTFRGGCECNICGNFFRTLRNVSLTLPANKTSYVCASINKQGTNGQTGTFVYRASESLIQKGNINGSDNVRDLLLYIVTTNANGVTKVQDKRIIKGNATQIDGIGLTHMTVAQYNAETTHTANVLYILTEN